MASPVGPNIDVSIRIGTGGTDLSSTGKTLILEPITSAISGQTDQQFARRARVYSTAVEVTAADESSAVDAAAEIYFGTDEVTPQELMVGSQFLAAQSHVYYCTTQDVTAIEGLGDTYTGLSFAGTQLSLDLDGENGSQQASTLQTALDAVISGTVVSRNSGRLRITVPASGDVGAGFTGAQVALDAFGLTNAVYVKGETVETVSDALTRIAELDASFSIVTFTKSGYGTQGPQSEADRIASASSWCQANFRQFVFEESGSLPVTANETTSEIAKRYAAGQSRVHGWYAGSERQDVGPAVSALLSSMSIGSQGSNVNLAGNDLSGVDAITLSTAEAAELDRKRANYYRAYSDSAKETVNGWTFKEWANTQYFVDLLRHELLTALFNARKAEKIVPWSPRGVAIMRVAIRDVLDLAVDGGFIAPGIATETQRRSIQDATGNNSFDGSMPKGYLIYFPALTSARSGSRSGRSLTGGRFWARGSEAINSVTISGEII